MKKWTRIFLLVLKDSNNPEYYGPQTGAYRTLERAKERQKELNEGEPYHHSGCIPRNLNPKDLGVFLEI